MFIEFIFGCGVVKNGSPVNSSVISGRPKLAVVLKSHSGTVGDNWNGVVKSIIIGDAVVSVPNGTNSVVSGIGGRPIVSGAPVTPSVTKSGIVVKSFPNIGPVVNILGGASVENVITVDKSISRAAPVVRKSPRLKFSSVVKAPKGTGVVSI